MCLSLKQLSAGEREMGSTQLSVVVHHSVIVLRSRHTDPPAALQEARWYPPVSGPA